jgi:energy-coupling factor transport system substrate-specific component
MTEKTRLTNQRPFYTTRDLLLMSALAALGGLASTYINLMGDFFQSLLGFAGTTQWAAGLHVLWLILAAGLIGKPGAGTITGILKGGVELFTGSTHGLLVVLVDIAAGVLVDLGLWPFRRRDSWAAYALAGGLASASNVFVFQLFAAVPADILTYGVIGLIVLVAFLSGVLFAGLLGKSLLNVLRSSGVVKDQAPEETGRWVLGWVVLAGALLASGLFGYLIIARADGGTVEVAGAVSSPYEFDASDPGLSAQTAEIQRGAGQMTYRGFPLHQILEQAEPAEGFDLVLIRGSDGYTFFISRSELRENPDLLLTVQGEGTNQLYNMVGPESKKAWVNGVVGLILVEAQPLPILGPSGREAQFQPGSWVDEMDSTTLDVGGGPGKYQGVPFSLVLEEYFPQAAYQEVILNGPDGEQVRLPREEIQADPGLRIFLILEGQEPGYAAAHLKGTVYSADLKEIQLR